MLVGFDPATGRQTVTPLGTSDAVTREARRRRPGPAAISRRRRAASRALGSGDGEAWSLTFPGEQVLDVARVGRQRVRLRVRRPGVDR